MSIEPPIIEAPKQKPKSASSQIISAIGAIFGVAVGYYCGIQLLIPLAIAFGIGWVLTKLQRIPEAFRGALAVQSAHMLWMLIGAATTGARSRAALDVLLLAAGLVWLAARPGLGPVILLGVYQLLAGIVNLVMLLNAEVATWQHKALVAHLAFRAAAVAFLVSGYLKTRKQPDVSSVS